MFEVSRNLHYVSLKSFKCRDCFVNHKKLFPKTDLQTRQMNDCALAELEERERVRRLRKKGKQVFSDPNTYFKCMLILGKTSIRNSIKIFYVSMT